MHSIKNVEHLIAPLNLYNKPEPAYQPKGMKVFQFFFGLYSRLFPKSGGKIGYRLFTTPRKRAKHQISDPILEKAKLFEILYEKDILKCYAWGNSKKIILLVHGWESRGTSLRSFVQPLVDEGFRVVTFDGPAHGNSSGKRTNLPHFAGAVTAVIRHLGGVHSIIAHSFGGASTIFALSHLDQEVRLKNLVLVGVPSSSKRFFKETFKIMNLAPNAQKHFFKIIISKLDGASFEETEAFRANGKIKVKDVLVVHDQDDPIVPFSSGRAIFENWDNANLLVTKGLGHYRLMKYPDLVRKVVDFITFSQSKSLF